MVVTRVKVEEYRLAANACYDQKSQVTNVLASHEAVVLAKSLRYQNANLGIATSC